MKSLANQTHDANTVHDPISKDHNYNNACSQIYFQIHLLSKVILREESKLKIFYPILLKNFLILPVTLSVNIL